MKLSPSTKIYIRNGYITVFAYDYNLCECSSETEYQMHWIPYEHYKPVDLRVALSSPRIFYSQKFVNNEFFLEKILYFYLLIPRILIDV